jgi:hypothetical protein
VGEREDPAWNWPVIFLMMVIGPFTSLRCRGMILLRFGIVQTRGRIQAKSQERNHCDEED